MKRLLMILSASVFMVACSKNEAKVEMTSTIVDGEFKEYLSVVDKEFVLKPNQEGEEVNMEIKMKSIKKCEECEYKEVRLILMDESQSELANLEFIRNYEGAVDINEYLNKGEGEFTLKFKIGGIGSEIYGKEEVDKFLSEVKFAKLSIKAEKIPTKAELLIGKEMFGGIICSTNKNGDHGLVVSLKDLGVANWETAKQLCDSDSSGGFNDWRLPTNEEFKLIHKNLSENSSKIPNENKIEDAYYWTSTVFNQAWGTTYPYAFNYSKGDSWHNYGMVNELNVRAVRAF